MQIYFALYKPNPNVISHESESCRGKAWAQEQDILLLRCKPFEHILQFNWMKAFKSLVTYHKLFYDTLCHLTWVPAEECVHRSSNVSCNRSQGLCLHVWLVSKCACIISLLWDRHDYYFLFSSPSMPILWNFEVVLGCECIAMDGKLANKVKDRKFGSP